MQTYLVLTGLGVGLFLLGHLLDFTGVAAIGATIVLAVGGAVILSGLMVQTGVEVTREYRVVNESSPDAVYNQTANSSEVVAMNGTDYVVTNVTREPVLAQNAVTATLGDDAGPLTIGGLQMLVGGLLLSQHLARRS